MSAEVLREAAALMRERAEAATSGPWVFGDTCAIAGVINAEADTCAYCRHDSKPSWVGMRDINGKRMRAHVHRREPWNGEVYARRDDGDIAVTTGTDEYGYTLPADAEHIASWHPAVALAVADWLDFVADARIQIDAIAARRSLNGAGWLFGDSASGVFRDMEDRALAVARIYLGADS